VISLIRHERVNWQASPILSLFSRINRTDQTTIIQVTHDREIAAMSDRVITLRDG
jgi:ABC-type lipoprotein export system ATPase subunit